eukprot:gene9749-biopygen379
MQLRAVVLVQSENSTLMRRISPGGFSTGGEGLRSIQVSRVPSWVAQVLNWVAYTFQLHDPRLRRRVLSWRVQHSAAQHCAAQRSTVQYRARVEAENSPVQPSPVQHSAAQHSIVRYSTVQYSGELGLKLGSVQHGAVQHCVPPDKRGVGGERVLGVAPDGAK